MRHRHSVGGEKNVRHHHDRKPWDPGWADRLRVPPLNCHHVRHPKVELFERRLSSIRPGLCPRKPGGRQRFRAAEYGEDCATIAAVDLHPVGGQWRRELSATGSDQRAEHGHGAIGPPVKILGDLDPLLIV